MPYLYMHITSLIILILQYPPFPSPPLSWSADSTNLFIIISISTLYIWAGFIVVYLYMDIAQFDRFCSLLLLHALSSSLPPSSLLFGTTWCFWLSLYISCPCPRVSHFSKELWCLSLESGSGTKTCVLGMLIASGCHLFRPS